MKKFVAQCLFLFILYSIHTVAVAKVSPTATTTTTPVPPANPFPAMWRAHPFYIGTLVGYGSTDWNQLIAHCDDPNFCLVSASAPISAGDSGLVWGFYMGYEIQPYFALELLYARFPNTTITFDEFSIYAFDYGVTQMSSFTYAYSISGKWMVQMGSTGLRGFATAGATLTHRHDTLTNVYHVNPTFGIGTNYVFPSRILLEIAFQYYAGYGKATLRPAIDYIPFLYSITARLAYRI